MKRRIALAAQLAAGVCLAAFVGTALADNGKDPPGQSGPPPGNSGNAPGQQKKEEAAPQPAAAQPQSVPAASEQGAQGHGKPDKPKPDKPGKSAKPAKADKPAQAQHSATQPSSVGTAQSSGNGRSDEAHHHVIICHRTGSDSNPYVVINIPLTAWHGGHTTHPSKNGRSDILLKDPASRPGSKDGFTKEDCAARAGVTPQAPLRTQVTTTPTTTTTTASAVTAAPSAAAVSGPSAAAPSQPTGGVAGVAARKGKPAGGVLGVSGRLGKAAVRGQLPFTGLPLWTIGLVALGLIGLGLALRRRSAHGTIL